MMKKISARFITRCAVIAALYCAVSLAMAPLSFGAVQLRAAEALAILPVFGTAGVWGVTLGCLITNACGAATGANILGAADIVFGTAATLAAALLSRRWGNFRIKGLPALSALPPVLINAAVIGAELTFAETGGFPAPLLALNMAQVGAGQAVSCIIAGLTLFHAVQRVFPSGFPDD